MRNLRVPSTKELYESFVLAAAARAKSKQEQKKMLDRTMEAVEAAQVVQPQQHQRPSALAGSINKAKRRMRSAGRATAHHLRLEEAANAATAEAMNVLSGTQCDE